MKKIVNLLNNFLESEKYIIIFLFFVALTARLMYLATVFNLPDFKKLFYDAKIFDSLAQHVIHRDIFLSHFKIPFEMSPGYTYFLAVISKILGCKIVLVKIMQIIIGSINCVLIYFIGKKIFNKWVGMIAAIIASYYGVFIFFESVLMPEFMILFLNSLMILFLIEAEERKNTKYWVIAGIFSGLSIITRPTVLIFIPFVLFWIYFFGKISKKEKFKYCVYFCLAAAIIILPITVRNYIVSNDLVLVTSSGGMNFYSGNNYSSQGVAVTDPDKFKYLINVDELHNRGIMMSDKMNEHQRDKAVASLLAGKDLKPSQTSKFWFKQGIKNISKNPVWWITLEIKKLILIINSYEVQDGDIPLFQMQRKSTLLRLPMFSYGVIFPLGFVGIILTLRNRKKIKIIYFFMISYVISMLIFHVASRYRLPLVPFFIIFGAYAIYYCYLQIRERKWDLLFYPLIIFIILASIVNYDDTFGYDFEINRAFIPMHQQRCNFLMENKEYLKAIDSAERLTELNPTDAKTFTNLGWIYFNAGIVDKAIESYKRAIDLDPYFLLARIDLAFAYYSKGSINDCIDIYQNMAEMLPQNPGLHNALGNFLVENEQYKEAEQSLKKAVDIFPGNVKFSLDLANIFLITEQYDKAITELEKIIETADNGYNDKIRSNLEICYLEREITKDPENRKNIPFYKKAGRFWYDMKFYTKARKKMEKIVKLAPNDAEAYYNLGQAYIGCGMYEEAENSFKKALKIKPDFIAAQVQLETLYEAREIK